MKRMTDQFLRVGAITKTHGLKGALKVYPTTDEPEVLSPGAAAFIDAKEGPVPVTVESVSKFKNLLIIKFKEFGDINDVELFKDRDLLMSMDVLPELKEDEYFISDLVDMGVFDEEDQKLGTIREVLQTGANDVYVVAAKDKDILIPAIHDCILTVNVPEKKMVVRLLPGLTD